jgi:tetratricopeptide (TPR) repeat protein
MTDQRIDALIVRARQAEKAESPSAALAQLRDAAKQFPNDQKIIFHIATVLENSKQHSAALGQYQRIAEKHEKMPPDVALGMARCLLALKRVDRAQRLFELLSEKTPKKKEVLVGLAGCKRHKKELEGAESLAREALAVDPDYMPARHGLAEVLFDRGSFEEALVAVEENVFREDMYGDSLDLWMLKLKEGKREKYMQDQLESLMRRFPKKVEFVFAYGVAANRAGEISLALPALAKADALLPNNPKILYELGVVERISGNIEKAQGLIQQSLALRPDFPAGLRTYGVDHKYEYGDDQFRRLNRAAAGLTEMSTEDQVQMQYALAKAFEDVGEYDAAFANYGIAGGKKRKIEEYNEKNNTRLFQVMAKVLNREFLSAPGQAGCQSDVPVFILGMPRSGTSLIEQILSSHPEVFGAGELKILTSVLENISIGPTRLRMSDIQAAFPYEGDASYEARGQRYVDQLMRLAPKAYKRIVDKMPGNFNFVGLIHLVLPKAKIIHSQRDPVETCLSCYRIHFAEGQQWSYNLRELGRYYRRYFDLMRHWREALPGVMYEIKYEDNVADVEGSARALIANLGLPWTDNCLRFYETERPVKTASASQVRKPIYNTSVNRWKKYEKYLEPLLEELGDVPAQYARMLEEGRKNR